MNDVRISISYERKYSDGDYGSEGLSMSVSGTLDPDNPDDDEPRLRSQMLAVLQREVLGALASQAASFHAGRRAAAEARSLGLEVPADVRAGAQSPTYADRRPNGYEPRSTTGAGAALAAAINRPLTTNDAIDLEDLPF